MTAFNLINTQYCTSWGPQQLWLSHTRVEIRWQPPCPKEKFNKKLVNSQALGNQTIVVQLGLNIKMQIDCQHIPKNWRHHLRHVSLH